MISGVVADRVGWRAIDVLAGVATADAVTSRLARDMVP